MLIDKFGRTIDYLRISVTDRCNLRCSYCIPKGFNDFETPDHWLTFDELMRVVRAFVRLGTKRFRLTGGEPLVRKNLTDLVHRIKKIDEVEDLSITTNGTLLTSHAKSLFEAGLDRLNISLDSLNRKNIEDITGLDCLEQVMEGLRTAKLLGFHKIKINMVVLPDKNMAEIERMLEFCIEHGFILCLIEVMPMGKTGQNMTTVSLQPIIQELRKHYDLRSTMKIIGNGPARYWETSTGNVCLGLITPLSQHFCATCNRVRLSVDGTLYMCLGQDNNFALRPLLRNHCSDKELDQAIQEAIELKPKEHDFLKQPNKIMRIMSKTGG
ncbi:GTP 3',8-cyclase MoaA [Commensalibacter sp. M0391]|nr:MULTISPECIES: GTP 3',8-cyclase MoaA [Commensalibacter]MBH9973554.1 GTP 3',8-cyclase MoaA [Commensalibacter melissae]MBI0017298.1 GTP 3',8-cyclase MoaA [Commensalibacter sp. B14384M2]MBI0018980.1 GTP 3',8-cyclase MoaA [Commensalibacter sp. W8133]MBI0049406.1 GTP 3',8-cyclase MoaA [Commensalibacter sp. B14384M3]MBI0179464.1 GTP 3',8-cyclase MoaA [Commensalibacter sp. W8163]